MLVEDDPELARRIAARLAESGFVVEHAPDARNALDWPEPEDFAAFIVDIGLPDMSGLALIERIRSKGNEVPIIVLSARGSWQEKVDGLNAGADDYVVKPVRAEEIVARLRALLRRAAGRTNARLQAGSLMLDQQSKTAWIGDQQIELTQTEFRLLQLFMYRAGHVLSQSEILDHIYPAAKERDINTVEVHIGRLRRKIGREMIKTIRGLGYRLMAEE